MVYQAYDSLVGLVNEAAALSGSMWPEESAVLLSPIALRSSNAAFGIYGCRIDLRDRLAIPVSAGAGWQHNGDSLGPAVHAILDELKWRGREHVVLALPSIFVLRSLVLFDPVSMLPRKICGKRLVRMVE